MLLVVRQGSLTISTCHNKSNFWQSRSHNIQGNVILLQQSNNHFEMLLTLCILIQFKNMFVREQNFDVLNGYKLGLTKTITVQSIQIRNIHNSIFSYYCTVHGVQQLSQPWAWGFARNCCFIYVTLHYLMCHVEQRGETVQSADAVTFICDWLDI